jgi:ABC-type glycerol-3-phosphate transport system substrate-binding protein
MKRKILKVIASIALLGMLLGGLPAAHRAPALAASRAAGLTGTLTVFDWGAFSAGPHGKKVVEAYLKAHPGVTIKFLPMPPGDPTVWEQSVLAAHAAPDIMVPPYTQGVFSDLGKNYWLDLTPYLTSMADPYVAGNKHWIDVFDPVMNKQNSFEGSKYYVVSWSAQDAAFFYNKALFKKVGIAQTPRTWADLLADFSLLKKAGIVPVLYPLGETYPVAVNGSIISVFENQVMGATFKRLDTDHNGIVDIKELVYGIKHRIYSPMNADYQEAWKLLLQFSHYWQPNATGDKNTIFAVSHQLFFKGQAATMYEASSVLLQLATLKVPFQWGMFEFPPLTSASSTFATGHANTGIWGAWDGDTFAVPATAKTNGHLALALDFLQWITTPQNDVAVAPENGLMPVTVGYKPADATSAILADLLHHPTMQFAAEATLGPEWLQKRIAVMQSYVLGMESLSQAMSDMQRYTDQAADQIIKMYHFSD